MTGEKLSRERKPPYRFKKGHAPMGGRPKGSPNKTTRDLKATFEMIAADPQYLMRLRRRALLGDLPPLLERDIWDRVAGKAKDVIEQTITHRLEHSPEQLAALARGMSTEDLERAQAALAEGEANARAIMVASTALALPAASPRDDDPAGS